MSLSIQKRSTYMSIQSLRTIQGLLLKSLGCIFVLSSIFKLIGLRTFAITVNDFCGFLGYELLYGHGMLLAVMICTAELGLGLAALIPSLRNYVIWLYPLVLSYFTYITGVNLLSMYGQIESCGCFGEVIHLTPSASFYKNVVLLSASLIGCVLTFILGNPHREEIG